jgi:hypothetical protein
VGTRTEAPCKIVYDGMVPKRWPGVSLAANSNEMLTIHPGKDQVCSINGLVTCQAQILGESVICNM